MDHVESLRVRPVTFHETRAPSRKYLVATEMTSRFISVSNRRPRAILLAMALIGSVSAVVVSTIEQTPASAAPVVTCTNTFLAADNAARLYRVDPVTFAQTLEFRTTQSTIMNGLASNGDLGIAYWGSAAIIYYYDSLQAVAERHVPFPA